MTRLGPQSVCKAFARKLRGNYNIARGHVHICVHVYVCVQVRLHKRRFEEECRTKRCENLPASGCIQVRIIRRRVVECIRKPVARDECNDKRLDRGARARACLNIRKITSRYERRMKTENSTRVV